MKKLNNNELVTVATIPRGDPGEDEMREDLLTQQ